MSKLMVIPDEDLKVLQKYFGADGNTEDSLILLPQKVLSTFRDEDRARITAILNHGSPVLDDYNHGGEADVMVDIVDSRDHYAMLELLDMEPEDDGEDD